KERALIDPSSNFGTLRFTVYITFVGLAGVRSKPPWVANVGVTTMLPATLPVCRRTVVLPFSNTAWVPFAGIVKVAVRPPLENCTAELALNTSETKLNARVPRSGRGYGDANVKPTEGCCKASCVPLAVPWN